MSWQRILRFAKVRQVPVIITDETGEDPMILLSLDQLEQALDGGVEPIVPPRPTNPEPTSSTPSFVPEDGFTFGNDSRTEDEASPSVQEQSTIGDEESVPALPQEVLSVLAEVDVQPVVSIKTMLPEIIVPPAASVEQSALELQETKQESVEQAEERSVREAVPESSDTQTEESPALTESIELQTPAVIQRESASAPMVTPIAQDSAHPDSSLSLEERFFLEY